MSFICIVCRDLLSNASPLDDAAVQGAAAPRVAAGSTDIVATKCGHLYHLNCLQNWFNKQRNPRQECPHCRHNVRTDDYQRIFLIGDEESEDIDKRLKEAKEIAEEAKVLKHENSQYEEFLKQTGTELADNKLALDILRYEFEAKSTELASLKSKRLEQEQILQSIENNFTEMISKLEKEKAALEKQVEDTELKLIMKQSEWEQQSRAAVDGEAATLIKNLTLSHEILRNEIRSLQEQLAVSGGKAAPSMRTMGSQTDAVPIALDSLTASMSRMEIVDLCFKYFDEEKKQQEAKSKSFGHVNSSTGGSSRTGESFSRADGPPVTPINSKLSTTQITGAAHVASRSQQQLASSRSHIINQPAPTHPVHPPRPTMRRVYNPLNTNSAMFNPQNNAHSISGVQVGNALPSARRGAGYNITLQPHQSVYQNSSEIQYFGDDYD